MTAVGHNQAFGKVAGNVRFFAATVDVLEDPNAARPGCAVSYLFAIPPPRGRRRRPVALPRSPS